MTMSQACVATLLRAMEQGGFVLKIRDRRDFLRRMGPLVVALTALTCAPTQVPSGQPISPATAEPSLSPVDLASCPVTPPNLAGPPDGEPLESVHLGNGKLGTDLWPDGTVVPIPEWVQPDGSIALKWPWWRGVGVNGLVDIEGRRLDANAAGFVARSASEGYGDTGFTPSVLPFPSAGCWEVTGRVDDASLTFVTRVLAPT
jgi:hypothetical protein